MYKIFIICRYYTLLFLYNLWNLHQIHITIIESENDDGRNCTINFNIFLTFNVLFGNNYIISLSIRIISSSSNFGINYNC